MNRSSVPNRSNSRTRNNPIRRGLVNNSAAGIGERTLSLFSNAVALRYSRTDKRNDVFDRTTPKTRSAGTETHDRRCSRITLRSLFRPELSANPKRQIQQRAIPIEAIRTATNLGKGTPASLKTIATTISHNKPVPMTIRGGDSTHFTNSIRA